MSTMHDGTTVTPELDARLIADIRAYRARMTPTRLEGERWTLRLTTDELDALLRAVDERDRLAREDCTMPDERPVGIGRELHAEPGAECTHEAWEERGGGARVCADCRVVLTSMPDERPAPRRVQGAPVPLPAGHALVDGEIVPLPNEAMHPLCAICRHPVVSDMRSTTGWRHVIAPVRFPHPAKPLA